MPKPTGSKISTTSGGGRCPSPKEHIQLSNNDWILAGDLKVGDEVMTSKEPQKVTRVQRVENSPRCEVLFEEGDSIVSSYTHPYFVNSKGFVEVGNLEKGDVIGDLVVKNKKSFSDGPVISLSVDEAETYMLRGGTKESPVPVLSHNKTPKRPDKIIKKRGGKRPARPGWGQALLGRSRRGWSHGGELSPKGYQQGRALTPRAVKKAWGMNRPHDPNASRRSMSPADRATSAAQVLAGKIPHFGPGSGGSVKRPPGGWSVGGALNPKKNKKKTGYQGGGRTGFAASTITAPKDQYGRTYGFKRRHLGKSFDPRVSSKAVQYARSQPPGGWNRGGPAKFRDDQSLGIRGGKVRKPVGKGRGG